MGGATIVNRFLAVFDNCEFHAHTRTLVHSESFRLVRLNSEPPNWNQAKPGKLIEVMLGPGTHLFIENTNHYYHFFANSIIPLLRAYEDGYLGKTLDSPLTFWLPGSAGEVQRKVLSAVAAYIGSVRICDVADREQLTGGQLLKLVELSDNYEWMPVDRSTADTLKQLLTASPTELNLPRRLYLDRQGAKLRQIIDGEAVRSTLASLGYSPFIAHGGNFTDQVSRFDAATHVVAVHGAGLTNLMFCRPGTKVLEIFPSNFVKSTFFALSKRLNLDYHYIIAGPGDYNQTFSVDINALTSKIKEMDE